jgi:glyoxylase-like metal-dependent hydrolase (beta-lactamase superfamily II)
MRVVRETNNLFRLTRLGMFNCFLVREGSELTLVDTNLPGSRWGILRSAASLGSRINRIALTHAHFDHVGSLDAVAKKLPSVEISMGEREARFLSGDFSLDPGETGKPLFGFKRARCEVHRLLKEDDRVGSLRVVNCPGHTPGHIAFLDLRDNSLIAGDSFMTQKGITAAGVYSLFFPMPAWFSWNGELCARSAAKLSALKPSRLAVGHGRTVLSPSEAMERAAAVALEQHAAGK